MQISFASKRLEKALESHKTISKKYGAPCARKIIQRLNELDAAPTLKDMPPAARAHPHKGDRQGLYSLDVKHPYRLIVSPDGDCDPIDPSTIMAVIVCEIMDPH